MRTVLQSRDMRHGLHTHEGPALKAWWRELEDETTPAESPAARPSQKPSLHSPTQLTICLPPGQAGGHGPAASTPSGLPTPGVPRVIHNPSGRPAPKGPGKSLVPAPSSMCAVEMFIFISGPLTKYRKRRLFCASHHLAAQGN